MDVQVATIEFHDEEGCARARVHPGNGGSTKKRGECAIVTGDRVPSHSVTADGDQNTDVQIVTVEFSSDHEREGGGGNVHQGKVAGLAGLFERKKLTSRGERGGGDGLQSTGDDQPVSSSPPKFSGSKRREKSSPPLVASKPKRTSPPREGENNDKGIKRGYGDGSSVVQVTEFDYVSRTSGQLFHVSQQTLLVN